MWKITENVISSCKGLNTKDLPDTISPNLHVLSKNNEICLYAKNIAGAITCKNDEIIRIRPKYEKINPVEMLEYINDIELDESREQLLTENKDNNELENIAIQFGRSLREMSCNHKLFQRRKTEFEDTFVRGKANWFKTSVKQSSGRHNIIYSQGYETTYEITENILISKAAEKVLHLVNKNTSEWNALHYWSELIKTKRLNLAEVEKVRGCVKGNNYSGAHAYYKNPLTFALIILGYEGFNDMVCPDSLLFDMPGLYEEYIRICMQRKCLPLGLLCQKGFVPRSFLFSDGTCELEPDLVVYEGTKIKAVMDVKYKKPDSKDFYQIFTYMKYAGLSTAYVLSPEVQHLENVVAYDGSKIISVRIDSSKKEVNENRISELLGII